jgi:uncharacterized membrane protein
MKPLVISGLFIVNTLFAAYHAGNGEYVWSALNGSAAVLLLVLIVADIFYS